VAVSIFVNPRQFGPNEDLDAYPRRMAQDAALLEAEGVALLWAPTVDQVYPDGYATNVSVSGLDAVLCGAARPGISMAWRRWCASCSTRCGRISRCSARRTGSSWPSSAAWRAISI
jgi:hypothetical protein